MKTHGIDEKLSKLLKDLDRMLNSSGIDQNMLNRLVRFGLTPSEAKAWLEREPSFTLSDVSYHEPSNRRRVTRTFSCCFSC
jgi:hypothetical protein